MEEVGKKKNVLIASLLLIIVLLGGIVVYLLLNKPKEEVKTTVITNEEALTIAKEKIEAANNLLGDFKSSYECTAKTEDVFCYYDTVDNFKNKFYSVYSKDLAYTDVFNEDKEGAPGLRIKDDKTYIFNHCTGGSGDKSLKGNYEIKSVTEDTITVKYIILDTDSINGTTLDQEAEAKLVKEDNTWKITKVTVLSVCNGIYEVGK